jgi:hypothetical protein
MKLSLLILMLACCSCDETQFQDKVRFVENLKAGDVWNPVGISTLDLVESNLEWAKYRTEIYEDRFYITVKNGRVVSIWTKKK